MLSLYSFDRIGIGTHTGTAKGAASGAIDHQVKNNQQPMTSLVFISNLSCAHAKSPPKISIGGNCGTVIPVHYRTGTVPYEYVYR